jgi:carbon-monoxide dehydrogenase small subunit
LKIDITTTINGRQHDARVSPNQTLLEFLREDLSLRGSVEGCGVGVCGSCTVLLDGRPVSSCLMLATNAAGKSITTIEGLAQNGELDPVQKAFLKHQAFQCGYCTPGMIMSAKALLDDNPQPSRAEIIHHMDGNICRCTGYVPIIAAIQRAADIMAKENHR